MKRARWRALEEQVTCFTCFSSTKVKINDESARSARALFVLVKQVN
jgi:hypothetical protein